MFRRICSYILQVQLAPLTTSPLPTASLLTGLISSGLVSVLSTIISNLTRNILDQIILLYYE
jgi:hypothetical protein